MALLMLSLIMSMLVVKLLHHGEKEVRQMSVSACLLDRYGSGSHDLAESVMTSIKTLDLVNGSDGELHTAPLYCYSCVFGFWQGGFLPSNTQNCDGVLCYGKGKLYPGKM